MKLNRLSTRHMRLVAAIASEGSLVRAAETLNTTQSAVTKLLHQAEELAGAQLFSRTNRGVVPTLFGEVLGRHARLVLAQIDSASQELSDLQNGTGGRISIGTLLAGSAAILPAAILRLQAMRPRVVIEVHEGTNDHLMPALRSGELDMIIGRLPEFRARDGFRQELLVDDVAKIVVRHDHPLVALAPERLHDLVNWPWILPGKETTLRRQIEAAFRNDGIEPPRPSLESVSLLTNRFLVMRGDYVVVLPREVAEAESLGGRIVVLPVDLPTTSRPVGVTLNPAIPLGSAARALLDILRDRNLSR